MLWVDQTASVSWFDPTLFVLFLKTVNLFASFLRAGFFFSQQFLVAEHLNPFISFFPQTGILQQQIVENKHSHKAKHFTS